MTQARPFVMNQYSSGTWTGYLKDASGSPIALSSIDSMTMTLYDKSTGDILNSRDGQDILGANNVTVHATSGLITWEIQPADNIINSSTLDERKSERHIALITVTYDTSKVLHFEINLDVINLEKVDNPA